MPTLQEVLASRWNPAWSQRSDLAPLKSVVDNSLGWSTAIRPKKAEIAKPGNLSRKGVAQDLRKWLNGGIARELRSYRQKVGDHAAGLKAQREALLKPQFAKDDLLGELQRQEVRSWLRTMEPHQRFLALLGDQDGSLVEASLAAQPALSGLHQLTDEQRQLVLDGYLEARHKGTVAALDEAAEANEIARVSCQVAVEAISAEVELQPHQFGPWMETGAEPELEAA